MATTTNKKTLMTKISAPSLYDAQYGANLNQVMQNIQENFNKMGALPFLQGADGNDFEYQKESLFEGTGTPDKNTNLSSWGKKIVKCILHLDGTSVEETEFNTGIETIINGSTPTLSAIYTYINSSSLAVAKQFQMINDGTNQVLDGILSHNTIDCYVTKDDSGQIVNEILAQYYYFLDYRVQDISLSTTNNDFVDQTVFLAYDVASGSFIKLTIVPTIYFNSSTGTWCWVIDGQKTGISANGTKGSQGNDGSKMYIVKCTYKETMIDDGWHKTLVDKVGVESSNEIVWDDPTKVTINDHDLCWAIIYKDDNSDTVITYTLGYLLGGGSTWYCNWHYSGQYTEYTNSLCSLLYGINNHSAQSTTMNPLRGLIVPHYSHNGADVITAGTDPACHALFTTSGGDKSSGYASETLNMGLVASPFQSDTKLTQGQKISGNTWPQFNLFYNEEIKGNLKVLGNTDLQGTLAVTGESVFKNAVTVTTLDNSNQKSILKFLTYGHGTTYNFEYNREGSNQLFKEYWSSNSSRISRIVTSESYNIFPQRVAIGQESIEPAYRLYVNGETNLDGVTQTQRLGINTYPNNGYQLHVNGSSYLDGELTVTGDAVFNQKITATGGKATFGDTEITRLGINTSPDSNYQLYVNGKSYLNDDTKISRLGINTDPNSGYQLYVSGKSYLNGDTDIKGNTLIDKLGVGSKITSSDYIFGVTGNSYLNGQMTVAGSSTFKDSISAQSIEFNWKNDSLKNYGGYIDFHNQELEEMLPSGQTLDYSTRFIDETPLKLGDSTPIVKVPNFGVHFKRPAYNGGTGVYEDQNTEYGLFHVHGNVKANRFLQGGLMWNLDFGGVPVKSSETTDYSKKIMEDSYLSNYTHPCFYFEKTNHNGYQQVSTVLNDPYIYYWMEITPKAEPDDGDVVYLYFLANPNIDEKSNFDLSGKMFFLIPSLKNNWKKLRILDPRHPNSHENGFTLEPGHVALVILENHEKCKITVGTYYKTVDNVYNISAIDLGTNCQLFG